MRHQHHENVLPLGPLMFWLSLVVILGVLGLCFVHMKHKLKADGDRCRTIERELAGLEQKNEVFETEILRLKSRRSIERRMQDGFISMIPVADSRMVRLRAQTAAEAAQMAGGVSMAPEEAAP